ncbi:MAG: hypothetical protein GPJ54_13790 [Candidatus Heimdallarchaeota archaeon]|nr:hypothetical protein [Candidatus Heimdallarchaeota archaeon]
MNVKYLRMDEMDIFRVMLGVSLFLLLSLIRGFIPVTIGYILNLEGVTSEMAAVFFIIPMISLFILPYTRDQYRIKFQLSIILWFLAVLMENLLIKYILILLGLYFVFSVLLFLLTIEKAKNNITESILIMVLFDFGLKSINRGNDLISYYNYFSIFITLLVVILAVFYVKTNIETLDVTPIKPISESSQLHRIHNSSIFAFFLGLLIYFTNFSNPGIITLSLDQSDQIAISYFIVAMTSISFLAYKYYPNFVRDPRLFYVTPVILLISVVSVPWIDNYAILSLLGLFSLIIMLNYNITRMPKHLSRQTSSLYFISLLAFLVFLFLIISKDGLVIPIVFTVGCGLFTAISYYFSKEWEVME